ncbi:MAG: hypothetical protein HY231_26555 [Acidobacteria bacterium]|nr:hypothetical protein [Acidobacteriota bacterium]
MAMNRIVRLTGVKLGALVLLLICSATVSFAQRRSLAVPRGTQMKIRLETTINSNEARTGDRFKATVLSPKRYADSILEGHISRVKQSGKFKGKTSVVLVFDRIRFDEGGSALFHADVARIYGNDAKVDEEGEIKSGSRGESTAKRTAGGAVAGAIIGGIAGGGKGAAIGATIGAGVGAGSNYIRGTNKVKIEAGTEMLIRAAR